MSSAGGGRLQRSERWMPLPTPSAPGGDPQSGGLLLSTPLVLLDSATVRPALADHLAFLDAEWRRAARGPRWCNALPSCKRLQAPCPAAPPPSVSPCVERSRPRPAAAVGSAALHRAAVEKLVVPVLTACPLTPSERRRMERRAAAAGVPTHAALLAASLLFVMLEAKIASGDADARRWRARRDETDLLPPVVHPAWRSLLTDAGAMWAARRARLNRAPPHPGAQPANCGVGVPERALVFLPGMPRFTHPAICGGEDTAFRPPGMAPTLRPDMTRRLAAELHHLLQSCDRAFAFDPVARIALCCPRLRTRLAPLRGGQWLVDIAAPSRAELANLLHVKDRARRGDEHSHLTKREVDFVVAVLARHHPTKALLLRQLGVASAAVVSDGAAPHLRVVHRDGSSTDLGDVGELCGVGRGGGSSDDDCAEADRHGAAQSPSEAAPCPLEAATDALRRVAAQPPRGECCPPTLRVASGKDADLLASVLAAHPHRHAVIGCGVLLLAAAAEDADGYTVRVVRRCGTVASFDARDAFVVHRNGTALLRGPVRPQRRSGGVEEGGPSRATVAAMRALYARLLSPAAPRVALRGHDHRAMLRVVRCSAWYYDGVRGCGISRISVGRPDPDGQPAFIVERVCGSESPFDESGSFDADGALLPICEVNSSA